jgi:hypothetical protein
MTSKIILSLPEEIVPTPSKGLTLHELGIYIAYILYINRNITVLDISKIITPII